MLAPKRAAMRDYLAVLAQGRFSERNPQITWVDLSQASERRWEEAELSCYVVTMNYLPNPGIRDQAGVLTAANRRKGAIFQMV